MHETITGDTFQAPYRADAAQHFVEAIAASTLPAAQSVRDGLRPTTWRAALELAATRGSAVAPLAVVLDEYPYLHDFDDGVDADLQAVWDSRLERLPVLFVCIGSNQAMMQHLLQHDRPLHGRPTMQLRVDPLSPLDVGELLQLDARDALDAYLVVGGFPAVAREWRAGASMRSFLNRELSSSSTPLVTNGERILNAELSGELNARAVREAIGLGERTFTKIGERSGVVKATLERSLKALGEKGLVTRRTPLSIPAGTTEARYQIVDPHLRFWLRFIGPHLAELERGRSDLVIARILDDWSDFRGPSIEPIVREAITRMLPRPQYGAARDVGGYWTRNNNPEIDLVGADSVTNPSRLPFLGSIKWREKKPFSTADAAALQRHRTQLPGAADDAILVGVSRTGFDTAALDVQLGPTDVVAAFARRSP